MSRLHTHALALVMVILAGPDALAFNIWKNRSTDDSVCDLAPNVTDRLDQKILIPAGTTHVDEIYARLAIKIVTENCRNGQTLILDTDNAHPFERSYFRETANRVCTVSEVQQVPVATQSHPNALQLRCTLTKVDDAATWLNKAESEKSTSAMISEGAPKQQGQAGSNAEAALPDCKTKKLTLGTLMFGGTKDCR